MGIYDREYYRGGSRPFFDTVFGSAQVTKWLILLNVAAFVLQLLTLARHEGSEGLFTDTFRFDLEAIYHGQVWRLLTYAFLHSARDIWHILFNMLFLYWFGRDLEGMYGSREFLWFYLTAAVLGGVAFLIHGSYENLMVFGGLLGSPHYCVGASGAVTAVMVLFACHFPTRVILVMFILPVPIWLLVLFQIVQDSFGLLSGNTGGTAVACHLGGAAFGFLYFRLQWRVSPLLDRFKFTTRRRARPKLRVYHGEERPQLTLVQADAPTANEQLEAKLDAVLEKIKTSGQDSLTEGERQILKRASEIYQKRRAPK